MVLREGTLCMVMREGILCIADLLQTKATVCLKKILLFYMYFYSTFALQCFFKVSTKIKSL